MKKTCRLCKQDRELQKSHIIPKFVGKYLKKTSMTGFLSAIDSHGNIGRTQDLFKKKLLCKNCESLISGFETYFEKTIFHPFNEGIIKSIPIDEKIGKFAVSVSLRVLWVLLEVKDSFALRWREKLFELEDEWRNYLIETPGFAKGRNSHHIIFHSKAMMAGGLLNNPNLIFHLMRSSAFYIYEKYNKAYISSNMAGIQIISMIEPTGLPVSRGTQVYPEQKFGQEKLGIGWGGYFQNLMDFSRDCNSALCNLTERQKQIISRAISKNINKACHSEDLKIFIEQESLLQFGRKEPR